jgi:hypothetical protein
VEQGPSGRLVASLFTFPRCLAQRMLLDIRKIGQALSGRLPLDEGTRAAARVAFVYVMTNLTWQLVRQLARGTPEEDKDLDEERGLWDLALAPEGMWNSVAYSPGGYGMSLATQVKDFMDALGEGVAGDAGADTKIARTLTRLAKTYVPFYRHIVAAVNIGLDRSMRRGSIDREVVTRIQNAMNKVYEYEQAPAQARTALEKFQAFLYGTDTGLVHATVFAGRYARGFTDADVKDYANRAQRYTTLALRYNNPFVSAVDKIKIKRDAESIFKYFQRRGITTDDATLSLLMFEGDVVDRQDFEKALTEAGMPSQSAVSVYVDEFNREFNRSKK